MSPTYWTASQIKAAARENGWEFIKCVDGQGPWGARKARLSAPLWRDSSADWCRQADLFPTIRY